VIKLKIKKKKEEGSINLGRVVRRAASGYKRIKDREDQKNIIRAPVQFIPSNVPMQPVKEEKKEEKGISLTETETYVRKRKRDEKIDLRSFTLSYPLIPKDSANPFAFTNIKWSLPDSGLVYYVVQPELSMHEKDLLHKIKNALIEKLDVDFTALKKGEARDYLIRKFEEMLNLLASDLPIERRRMLLYYIERDFVGLGKIEPLMQDSEIEDISCDGVGVPIYIYHRNSVIGSIRTNIVFRTAEELDIFVNKLAQRCGKSISVADPLLNGSLPDGSRAQITLGTDIARRGSNFTIRKFSENPLTPVHLFEYGTIDPAVASYLWFCIEYGKSFLVTGGTATGKTSLLNALSLFIKSDLKIISIEDTPELKLPHPHWVPSVARTPIAEVGGRKIGEVDLFDLLKESLRQRPDYLIVGEVRGKEAYVLFQQVATGHPSMATIHADSMDRLMNRLTTPPISLPPNLIQAIDIIIFIVRIKHGNKYVRRVSSIYEIVGFDREEGRPITNLVYKWDPSSDKFVNVKPSIMLERISKQYGLQTGYIQKEIKQRQKVMKWAVGRKIRDYKDFTKVIKMYYTRTEDLLSSI